MGNKPAKIQTFDTRVSRWKSTSNVVINSREDIHKLFKSLNITKKCLCAPDDKDNKNCLFRVKKRIGSDSNEGYVYEIKFDKGFKAASKILPILDQECKEKMKNEIMIATLVSDLVISGKSIYFPILYTSVTCDNTVYSLFRKTLPRDVLRGYILYQLNIDRREKKLIREYVSKNRNASDKEFSSNINKIVGKQNKIDMDNVAIPSTIMFSELAWGDLRQYINIFKNENNLIYLCKHVIHAIIDLQKYNIIHDDLHTGNILVIMLKDGKIVPLIHDFGKSILYTTGRLSRQEKLRDVVVFVDSVEREVSGKNYKLLSAHLKNIKKIKTMEEINIYARQEMI